MGFIDKIKEKMNRKEKVNIAEAVIVKDIIIKDKEMVAPSYIGKFSISYIYKSVDVAIALSINFDYSKLDELELIPEPENEYDKRAIKVVGNGLFLGYISKGKIQDMIHDWLKNEEPIFAGFKRIDFEKNILNMYIVFYRDHFKGIEKYESLKTKLIKTSKKIDEYTDRQNAFIGLHRGDKLTLEYDAESETYIAITYRREEVGEISKSISAKILEREDVDEPICLIEETTIDHNDNFGANVLIYFK